ncbi:MAG: hypothetical protein KGI58_03830 [Patescibacteria group bacterium]|nr:hypothetical protein [Patescibacteria group bacterium]
MKNSMSKMYVGGLIVAMIFFFIGFKVGQSKSSSNQLAQAGFNNRGFGGNGGTRGLRGPGGGFTTGKIISSDSKSVTVSLKDGGSKIIYISDTTSVLKSITGSKTDLVNGDNIMVTGTPNQDGSIAAQSIQIRP